VLFCDLADSTELAESLDPEETRDSMQRFHGLCGEIVERHGGYVARLVGDGLLVYFGYPTAHGDDPARAVQAALDLVEAVPTLGPDWPGRQAPEVRIGLDTGEVVVGEMGAGHRRQAADVVGRAPNIAARLQARAEPGTVVVTDSMRPLIDGYVVLEPLGDWFIRGLARPVAVHRVVGRTGARSRFDVAQWRGLTEFVGRARELGALHEQWQSVRESERGASVVVVGEAGIGKTRLVHEFVEAIGSTSVVARLSCAPDHEQTPLHPVVRHFAEHDDAARLGALGALLGLQGAAPAPDLPPRRRFEDTVALVRAEFASHAAAQPRVVVVEDLHWADPTTLDLVRQLVEGEPIDRTLVVVTTRPELKRLPFGSLQLVLERLPRSEIAELIGRVVGPTGLGAHVVDEVVERADGIPLYIEELTRAVVEAQTDPEGTTVPATLYDSLMARLDRVRGARELVGAASVIGRSFSLAALARVLDRDHETVAVQVDELAAAGLFRVGPAGEARFGHALLRDAAYGSLLIVQRRRLHGLVGDDLLAHEPERADAEPEVLARHFAAAGDATRAIGYWRQVATLAEARGAIREAEAATERALDLVDELPTAEERDHVELRLLQRLATFLYQTVGGSNDRIGDICARSYELAQRAGGAGQQVLLLAIACAFAHDSADYHRHLEISEELLAAAEMSGESIARITAASLAATANMELGHVRRAQDLLDDALVRYRPDMHEFFQLTGLDIGVTARHERAWALWHRGAPDAAAVAMDTLFDDFPVPPHAYPRAVVDHVAGLLHFLRRDVEHAVEAARRSRAVAEENGFDQINCNLDYLFGWAECEHGHPDVGVERIRVALDRHRKLGGERSCERGLTMLALGLRRLGRDDDAVAALHEGQQIVHATGGLREAPDLWRIEGEIAAARGDRDRGLELIRHAIDLARRSESVSYELRALTSLLRLAPGDASVRDELAAVYAIFTDGFTLPDLREAADLLATTT